MKKITILKRLILVVFIIAIGFVVFRSIRGDQYAYQGLLSKEVFEAGSPFTSLTIDSPVEGFEVVKENDKLMLLINTETTEICVFDKRNSETWYSNPAGRNEDSLANPSEKAKMSAQIEFNYYNQIRKELYMNNFNDAIEKKQFKIESLQEGVRITYTMGNVSLGYLLIPDFISEERLNSLVLEKLDKKTAKDISRRYVPSTTKEGLLQLNARTRESVIVMDEFLKAFQDAGYTEDDLKIDLEAAGMELDFSKSFVEIPMEFTLHEEQLRVKIPTDRVIESEGVEIVRLDVLKFFGAGSLEDEGYMVVPSGSGGLIYFNNGKQKEDPYLQPIYGVDPILQRNSLLKVEENVRLPIFGIQKNEAAFVAYIEEGASIGTINAKVSQNTGSYNYIYPSFNIRGKDMLSMSGVSGNEADLTILQEEHFQGDIIINYCFLYDDDADYSGMAKYYQEELMKKGILAERADDQELPFYLDLIGVVEKDMHLVGFPYTGLVNMTTYEQAEQIVNELADQGVQNIQASYLGWFNDGMNHDVVKKIQVVKSLGKESQLESLQQIIEQTQGKLFLDVALQLINYKSKNYSEIQEAARYLDGFSGVYTDYNRAFLKMGTNYWAGVSTIVSPNALPEHVDLMCENWFDETSVANISLRDLGSVLTSDQKKQYPIDREAAKKIVQEQFHHLDQEFNEILVRGGNDYSFAYADHMVDVPETNNKYFLIDEQIPFYQMVINGCMDYSGSAINISEAYDYRKTLLRAIEYDMAPHFIWSYEPTSNLNKTAFEDLYSTQYSVWIESAISLYQELNEVDQRIGEGKLQQHEIISKGVNKVSYDNGTEILINYTQESITVDGVTINAMDYALKGGKE